MTAPLFASSLTGRTALITGGSRGIGRVLAESLARAGVRVVFTGRDPRAIDETLAALRAAGTPGVGLPLELSALDDPAPFARALGEHTDRLDILVLNAAIGGVRTPVVEQPLATWREVFQVNVHACLALLMATDPLLKRSDAGRVVFISTGVARRRKATTGAYAASKAAFEMMAGLYCLDVEASPIRGNIVNPGPTRTEMRAAAFPAEDPMTVKPPEALMPLLHRLCAPECDLHGQTLDADDWIASQSSR